MNGSTDKGARGKEPMPVSPSIVFERDDDAHVLKAEQWLPLSPDALFPFYADARNLERITPSSLQFQVLTDEPLEMRQGLRIDYRLRLRGMPMRWRSVIRAWEPPHRFVDEQERGPYRLWWHEHRFDAEAGGTRVSDRVRYLVPGGAIIERTFVRPELRRIFTYRHHALEAIFGDSAKATAGGSA